MEETEVLILGGGLSGLAAGWWLAQAGIATEIWEQDSRAGGKIATRRADGYTTEQGASLMFNYRTEVRRLLEVSGLDAQKHFPPAPARRRYLVQDGGLIEVPTRAGALLRSPLWSWRGRLRLLAEPFIARGGHDDETVSELVCRRLGREFLDKAMEPFVAGVLAADPDRAHARTTLPRLSALEQRYGSLALALCARKLARRGTAPAAETFSFTGGMATLTETLARAPGVTLRTAHRVTAVHPLKCGWSVVATTPQGERVQSARHLVLSLPANASAELLRPGDPELARLLDHIEYAPLAVVHLGFDRAAIAHPLAGMGCLVPRREASALTGVQWISSLFPERAPPGKVLLSAYLGGARCAEIREWEERRCVDAALRALRGWLGIRGEPERLWVDRHARALPLYHGAYGALVRAVEHGARRWPGLHFAANFLGGISTRDRIVSACALAERIRQSLGSGPPSPAAPGAHHRAATEAARNT